MANSGTGIATEKDNYTKQIIILGSFFFIFGFITWVNGTLIPYLRIACELEEWQTYLVTFAFYISYTVMALPASKLLQYTGMVKGMRLGLGVMAIGCLLFVPAALYRTYAIFLLGLFITGTGLTILQAAVNPYITLLGPPESAAKRISIMGICNKFAGVIAPIVLGAIILTNAESLLEELEAMAPTAKVNRLDELAKAVILPYGILTVALLAIAYGIKYVHLPEINMAADTADKPDDYSSKITFKQYSNFLLGFIAIFCTVGVEVVAGDTIGNYGLHHGLSLDVAKDLTSYTLFGMMIGYVLGVFAIPTFISQEKAFFLSNLLGIATVIAAVIFPGVASVGCIAVLGFANALLWPAIWPQALSGLSGNLLNKASAILIMGIAGGAIMPLVYGWISQYTGNQLAYLVIVPCYLFNLYYWLHGKLKTNH
jgi:MFS transporter, FHS family, L-fucose permease